MSAKTAWISLAAAALSFGTSSVTYAAEPPKQAMEEVVVAARAPARPLFEELVTTTRQTPSIDEVTVSLSVPQITRPKVDPAPAPAREKAAE